MAVAAVVAAAGPPRAAAQAAERSLTIYNIHTKETTTAAFKRNGRFVEAGLAALSHAMRDHRRNESIAIDPELIDLLWQVHAELGSREPIHLISGYRSRATNDMLRRTSGGQASESRHILGKAADVHFPDVPIRKLRYSALIHEKGGVGYYPTSALPFVHLDTGNVRSWPRLPRHELALLFPSGETRHAAADGGSVGPEDARAATTAHRELARDLAAFHSERKQQRVMLAALERGGGAVRLAAARDARPAMPQAIAAAGPTLVELPRRVTPALPPSPPPAVASLLPSAADRARLAELAGVVASLPQLIAGPAPARRPERPALPSLAGAPPAFPASPLLPAAQQAPQRQVAALGPVALPARAGLDEIATLLDAGAFVPAPAFDDEHPDELSYRPFPILPQLTDTAGVSLMSNLVAPDFARTLEVLDQPDPGSALRLRPAAQAVGALWAQQFSGAAVGLDKLHAARAPEAPIPAGLKSRAVRTSER